MIIRKVGTKLIALRMAKNQALSKVEGYPYPEPAYRSKIHTWSVIWIPNLIPRSLPLSSKDLSTSKIIHISTTLTRLSPTPPSNQPSILDEATQLLNHMKEHIEHCRIIHQKTLSQCQETLSSTYNHSIPNSYCPHCYFQQL
ncbi:hypothetical protein ACOSQ2_025532 [Xanthoceras sorbifolium]